MLSKNVKFIYVFFLLLILEIRLSAKDTFSDNSGNAGHADDLSKLLTGKGYNSNSGNHKLFPVLKGFAYIMYLTVDSTGKDHRDGSIQPIGSRTYDARKYINAHKTELKIKNIPNINEFLTPGGNTHGEYTHLGWDHPDYSFDTDRKWLVRKEILRDFLGKQFDFGLNDSTDIIKPSKRDSFAALLYYVHILGDHENNTITTTRSRIPIKSLNEQDDEGSGIITHWERNNKNENGIPTTTIIAELNKHIKILFKGQEQDIRYKILINDLNGYLPEVFQINETDDKTERAKKIQENQREKAKWILQRLFENVPYLLKEEPFAKGFYRKMER